MDMINSPMARLARLYNAVESKLRKAANDKKPIFMIDLMADEELLRHARDKVHVQNVVRTLADKGYAIRSNGRRHAKYEWNLSAGPFVFSRNRMRQIVEDPSDPEIERAESAEMAELPENTPESTLKDQANKVLEAWGVSDSPDVTDPAYIRTVAESFKQQEIDAAWNVLAQHGYKSSGIPLSTTVGYVLEDLVAAQEHATQLVSERNMAQIGMKPVLAPTATPKPPAVQDEIEVVVNGIEIVAGVNPATGRLRISFETK